MSVRPTIAAAITDLDSAKAWIKGLHEAGLMFHFEDSPETIVTGPEMVRTFTDEEAPIVRERVDALYALEWGEHECPLGYFLDVIQPNDIEGE